MKQLIILLLLIGSFVAFTTRQASAVVYCVFGVYQPGCVARPVFVAPRAVVVAPRPVIVAPRRAVVGCSAPKSLLTIAYQLRIGWTSSQRRTLIIEIYAVHESPIGTFRKCPARWCLGSSKWAFNGGHRYIRTRRNAAHPPAHTQTALMLALHWPSEPRPLDPLPFGHWSRRTPVTIGIGRYRLSSLLARDGARTTRSTERSNARRNRWFLNFLSGSRAGLRHLVRERHMPVGTMATRAIVPRTEPAVLSAVVNLRRGSKWLVNGSLVPEPRYADNSQSVSQKAEFSGWLKRKTGRVCRTKVFAASQSKNRLPHAVRGRGCRTV